MRLAISNLAWGPQQDREVADLLQAEGVRAIELAPTKLWPVLSAADPLVVRSYRDFWRERDIEIVAFQSLLFGQPHLAVFGEPEVRREMLEYLTMVMDLAAALGARALVFGSPKNRLVGDLPAAEAWELAVDFFGRAGAAAEARGVALCIEHNPPAYGCDFVTTPSQARDLVADVGSPGFRLHLDTACARMADEDLVALLPGCMPYLEHFHVSREQLLPVGEEPDGRLSLMLGLLERQGYMGAVSIEMREAGAAEQNLAAIKTAVRHVKSAASLA